ncbi:MAG: tetratricopeptide repeat protein [Desulfomonile tiedjei]|nr:tetratricopeptide repeat protein [Desulfomonile tiedjei]
MNRLILACSLASLCVVVLAGGCARKVPPRGMPFGLNLFFEPRSEVPQDRFKEKGIRLAREEDFSSAIEAFTQHVLEEPESFSGFNAIGVCYKNMGDHANAMKNFERSLEFADSPEERAKVLANIGHLYFSVDKHQVAMGYYQDAARESEKNPLYLIFIARTYLYLDEPDRARRVLAATEKMSKDFRKYEPDDDKGLGSYLLADCYSRLNEWDKVIQYLEAAMKANPSKYVPKLVKAWSDQTSLLYTLKGDTRLEKAIRQYSPDSR